VFSLQTLPLVKRLFIIAAFGILTAASTAHAQQMMAGVRWGVNFANEHYSTLPPIENISGRTLGFAGGEFDYRVNNLFGLSIQLLYDQKGARADMVVSNGPPGYYGTADWTTNYLDVPLLLKLSYGSGDIRPYIFAGPSVGFLLSNTETLQTSGTYSIPNGFGAKYRIDTTANISDFMEPIDISIVAGAGIALTLPTGQKLFVDAAYAYGLTNSDNYSWDNDAGIYVYSRDIRLAAGILFPLN
jgi:hypothetical protein